MPNDCFIYYELVSICNTIDCKKMGIMLLLKKKIQENREENEYEEIQKSINNIFDVHVAKCDCNASFSKCGKAEQKECFPQCR